MGCEATPNGGPAARIAASYLVSGYTEHIHSRPLFSENDTSSGRWLTAPAQIYLLLFIRINTINRQHA